MKQLPLVDFKTSTGVRSNKKLKDASTSIKGMLRSKKGDKKGIYIRVTIDRGQEYYSTGYYVLPKNFDVKSGLVKGKTADSEKINSYIRHMSKDLDDILSNLKKSNEILSIKNYIKFYELRFRQEMSFEEFFDDAINAKKKNIEPSTLEVYRRLPSKILEFRQNITLRNIDKTFIKEWEQWLIHEKGVCQNTANHYLETLRTFLIIAEEEKLIDENPFRKIKISKVIGERDYLTEEELNAFMEVEIPQTNTGELRAREMFVFCCLTGIRYSDLVALKWKYIRLITNDMFFKMQKTKTNVTIPLIDKAKQILNRQDKNSENVFKSITNQKFNEHLHAIEKRAKIQKNITVHVARHTFATLALERGIALEVVSKILGHTNIKMTMIYAKITQKRLSEEMQKLNGIAENIQNDISQVSANDVSQMILKMQEIVKRMENLNQGTKKDIKMAG